MTDKSSSSATGPLGEPKGTRSSTHRKASKKISIPTVDQILQQLMHLNSVVAFGAMSSRDASLINKNLKIVLDVQMKRANREDSGPSQEALSEFCRNDPRLLNALEPFLADDQVEWLMSEITDDQDEQV